MTDLLSKERLTAARETYLTAKNEHMAAGNPDFADECADMALIIDELLQRREAADYDRAEKEPAYWVYDTKFGLDISKEKPEYEENTAPYFPVFTAPPLPVVPNERTDSPYDPSNMYRVNEHEYNRGWNACRAAMLQSVEHKS
ncbi:hypothetical protein GMW39_00705 [Pectobacterium parmentieri]|uniref:hypothetical protein n=1 Tax=Pectobacterium parmentieri TaxID=1905730 RepID=UPI001374565F|nr:hypothetical protein [Pectobacterium parmentieri]QHQ14528.1 hypothetical protein GMW39_00705 [Pectobacterium parmentieri]QQA77021.1 hypothetical protein JBL47_05305 [Pectobacterium parmentieri]